MKARENDTQISDDEDEYSLRRKDVEKNLKCVTIGIEKNRAVETLSKRQQIKKGKVRAIHFIDSSKVIVLFLRSSETQSKQTN